MDYEGRVLLDELVRPPAPVLNYRTEVTGIKQEDLASARGFYDVRSEVIRLLKNRLVVGHSLANDLKALEVRLPRSSRRDTQEFFARYQQIPHPKLKVLCARELGRDIQQNTHSSVSPS